MAESSAKSETKKATPKAAPVKSAPSVDLSKAKELGLDHQKLTKDIWISLVLNLKEK